MRTLATVVVLLFGAALIFVHQRYNSAISKALDEEATPVPIPLGPIDSEHSASIRFEIRNIQHNQRIAIENSDRPSSNDWTVFDCIPLEDPAASFRLALSPLPPITGQMPTSSSDAILWVTNREAGDRLLQLFAGVFGASVPARRNPPAPLKALKIGVSVLGQHLPAGDEKHLVQKDPQDESARGPWTATRWFIEDDGLESEVWFNYDLQSGRGEIVRKNADDADAMLSALATCLRDGPRPPRTPADDPTLTDVGPHVRDLRRVAAQPASSYFFTPRGSIILLTMDAMPAVLLAEPTQPDKPREIARIDGLVAAILCADDRDEVFLIQEAGMTGLDGMAWWQSPQRIWRIDRKNNEKRLVAGPWGQSGSIAGPLALSPDGRFLVISYRRTTADGERFRATYFHDFTTGRSVKAPFDSTGEVISWIGRGADSSDGPIRCNVMTGGSWRFNPDFQRQSYVVDPATGSAEPVNELSSPDPLISPDGKLRAALRAGDRIDVTDVASGSKVGSFTFHEDDRRFAREGTIAWLSPRFLIFRGKRHATIDVTTMKMCYLFPPEETRVFQFSRNFDWAITNDEQGLYVGRVVIDSAAATQPIARAFSAHKP